MYMITSYSKEDKNKNDFYYTKHIKNVIDIVKQDIKENIILIKLDFPYYTNENGVLLRHSNYKTIFQCFKGKLIYTELVFDKDINKLFKILSKHYLKTNIEIVRKDFL